MTFQSLAQANTPARYRKSRGPVFEQTHKSYQGVEYVGLALVEKLLSMGLKEEAVKAYRAHKAKQKEQ